jgi:hypothetical protein
MNDTHLLVILSAAAGLGGMDFANLSKDFCRIRDFRGHDKLKVHSITLNFPITGCQGSFRNIV